ncbi:MAG: 6-carboxytetrahydropterin synthase [Bacteroidales bacterium]|nr:6-carboxytetrahydropterin synthase [Bacteroidales bacterium]
MIYLTRRERFSAAHRLFQPGLSDIENLEFYGSCANPNWHGHNYVLWVTVKGEINRENGYLVDLKKVSKILKDRVVDKLDHKNINLEVDFMKDMIVSTENLAVGIWNQIEPGLRKLGIELHSVKLQETENNIVEYFGK